LTSSFEPSTWRKHSELQQLLAHDLLDGAAVGFVGGFTSGLLGVSPGGGLVVFSGLLLGAEQHAAQGISLVAQVFPTSLSGIRRYWQKGHRTPLMWLVLLGVGFLIGGAAGAKAAAAASRAFLQWTFVLYLVALGVLAVARPPRRKATTAKLRRLRQSRVGLSPQSAHSRASRPAFLASAAGWRSPWA
jgi:uncharacterized membrane protein YfcA